MEEGQRPQVGDELCARIDHDLCGEMAKPLPPAARAEMAL
jgi:hypothetical protein